mmetsp:Transcript_25567/g.80720  ORF Transcript_25567/g.80720 Transcript_25567/m.80720 type:complete len:347 (-) Transcript_25567:986-2026(-)
MPAPCAKSRVGRLALEPALASSRASRAAIVSADSPAGGVSRREPLPLAPTPLIPPAPSACMEPAGFIPPPLRLRIATPPPPAPPFPARGSTNPTRGPPPKRWLKFSSRFWSSSLKNFISSYVLRTSSSFSRMVRRSSSMAVTSSFLGSRLSKRSVMARSCSDTTLSCSCSKDCAWMNSEVSFSVSDTCSASNPSSFALASAFVLARACCSSASLPSAAARAATAAASAWPSAPRRLRDSASSAATSAARPATSALDTSRAADSLAASASPRASAAATAAAVAAMPSWRSASSRAAAAAAASPAANAAACRARSRAESSRSAAATATASAAAAALASSRCTSAASAA